jgi:excisionase family DNA binding protein
MVYPETSELGYYLTVSEAAAYLGVSASTLRNWDRAGKLKPRRHPMNKYRLYHKDDLVKIIEEMKKTP